MCFGGTEIFQHIMPDLCLYVGVGLVELYLIEEAALKGFVEVACQVGGGDEDAVKVFYLLQDDVLHGIVHLIDRVLYVLRTLVDDGICLVEEEDGHHIAGLTELAIMGKDLLDVLLALAYPLVAQSGYIDLHDVAPRLPGYLKDGLGLTRARRTIEKTCEAFAHALRFEPLLDGGQIVLTEQTGEDSSSVLVLRVSIYCSVSA